MFTTRASTRRIFGPERTWSRLNSHLIECTGYPTSSAGAKTRHTGEPNAMSRERPVLPYVALYRVLLGTDIRTALPLTESTHRLGKVRSSKRSLGADTDDTSLHRRNMYCHHAWHLCVGLRMDFSLKCPSFRMVGVCATVPTPRDEFRHRILY